MRRALLLSFAIAACTAPYGKNVPIAPGGSASDFDRGAWGSGSPATGTPSGSRDTIGNFDFAEPAVVAPAPLPPLREEVTGTPDEIRRLQRALADKGYYHGPVNGVADAALADALRRYRADTGGEPTVEAPPPPTTAIVPDGGVRDGG